MTETKKTCIISFLTLSLLIFTAFFINVKAANAYGDLEVDDTWTVEFKEDSDSQAYEISFKVTEIDGETLKGDINAKGEEHLTDSEDIDSFVWTQDFINQNVEPICTNETKEYGGEELECYVTESLSGYNYLAIAKDTGIVLEIDQSNGPKYKLINWEYEAPLIPGYELPFLFAFSAIGTLGLIHYLKKRNK